MIRFLFLHILNYFLRETMTTLAVVNLSRTSPKYGWSDYLEPTSDLRPGHKTWKSTFCKLEARNLPQNLMFPPDFVGFWNHCFKSSHEVDVKSKKSLKKITLNFDKFKYKNFAVNSSSFVSLEQKTNMLWRCSVEICARHTSWDFQGLGLEHRSADLSYKRS